MEKGKVITVCGSLRFQEEIMRQSMRLELEGNCVLSIIYPTSEGIDLTEEQHELLSQLHFQRIDMAEAIFVVNVGGYIGEHVKKEIEYAKNHDKEIIYLEN